MTNNEPYLYRCFATYDYCTERFYQFGTEQMYAEYLAFRERARTQHRATFRVERYDRARKRWVQHDYTLIKKGGYDDENTEKQPSENDQYMPTM